MILMLNDSNAQNTHSAYNVHNLSLSGNFDLLITHIKSYKC